MQNARPGVFEDAEVAPADVEPPLPVAVPVEIPEQVEPQPIQAPAPPATNGHAMQETETDHRPPIDEDEPQMRSRKARRISGRDDGAPHLREAVPRSAQNRGKRIDRHERMAGVVGPVRTTKSARPTKRQRRSPPVESSESPEDEPAHRSTAVDAKPLLDLREEQTRFTFRAPSGLSDDSDQGEEVDSDGARSESPLAKAASSCTSLWDSPSSRTAPGDADPSRPHTTNPDVPEDVTSLVSPTDARTPVDVHAPRELPSPILASPPSDGTLSDDDDDTPPSPSPAPRSFAVPRTLGESSRLVSASSSVPNTPSGLRRPPLPSVTLPSPSSGIPPSASASISRGPTPLASPSLATYSAPEEFEPGPSKVSGYFGRRTSDAETPDMQAEHDQYFRTEEEATEVGDDEEGTEHADGPWPETQEHLEVDVPVEQEQHAEGGEQAVGDGNAREALRPVLEDMQRMADEARDLGVRLNDLQQQLDDIQVDENMEDDMDGALEGQSQPFN